MSALADMRSRSRAIAVAPVSLPSAAFIQAGINGEEAFSLPSYPHPENGSQNGRYDDLFSHILLAISGETRHADRIRELIEQQGARPTFRRRVTDGSALMSWRP